MINGGKRYQLPSNASLPKPETPEAVTLEPTPSDVLGPFFVLGSPFRAMLAPPGVQGDRIIIKGRVLDTTGQALPFTMIDFWQANPESAMYDAYWADGKGGRVYHPSHDPDIVAGKTGMQAKLHEFRVKAMTDHLGRFEVDTVVPPPYFDPDDVCECKGECLCAWRCPHVHAFVQPTTQKHNTLITQLYFENMPYNDTDKHFNTKTLLKTSKCKRQEYEYMEGTFDFVLSCN